MEAIHFAPPMGLSFLGGAHFWLVLRGAYNEPKALVLGRGGGGGEPKTPERNQTRTHVALPQNCFQAPERKCEPCRTTCGLFIFSNPPKKVVPSKKCHTPKPASFPEFLNFLCFSGPREDHFRANKKFGHFVWPIRWLGGEMPIS